MTLVEQIKIDNLSYIEMLRMWRFTPLSESNPLFQGDTGKYFTKVMREKESKLQSGEKASISKYLGW